MTSAAPAFELNGNIFNQRLYDQINKLWFSGQDADSKAPTKKSMAKWFGVNQEKTAATQFDSDCRSTVLHALEQLYPEHVQLPMAETWQDEQHQASSLASPFLVKLQAAEAEKTSMNAISLVLLLDQFPRNIFRSDQTIIYTHLDRLARALVHTLLAQPDRPDKAPGIKDNAARRMWFGLPLMHSEYIEDHDLLTKLMTEQKQDKECNVDEATDHHIDFEIDFEERHAKIIRQFGRYPYRNKWFGRETTDAEKKWEEEGGEHFTA